MNVSQAMSKQGPNAPYHPIVDHLLVNSRGHFAACAANIRTIYLQDPRKRGHVRYNTFDHYVVVGTQRLDDQGEMRESLWLADTYGLSVKPREVGEVLKYIGTQDPFHPVQDYLRSLVWDGTPRLDKLFIKYFGAQDEGAIRAYGRKFMISSVARNMNPGAKADAMVILFSQEQGRGKSRGAAALAPFGFSDAPLQVGDREAVLALHGCWIYEVAELDSFRGRAAQKVKAFLSTSVDRYRGLYARHYTQSPRSCVFIGTTNEERFLRDSTGNRRFWPVRVGWVEVDELIKDRDQLWAEAYVYWSRGEEWWLSPEDEAKLLGDQEMHKEVDPWASPVVSFMEQRIAMNERPPRMHEILTQALGVELGRQDKRCMLRVSDILTENGYYSKQVRRGRKKFKAWVRR
mgnify:CR=1 FL=1